MGNVCGSHAVKDTPPTLAEVRPGKASTDKSPDADVSVGSAGADASNGGDQKQAAADPAYGCPSVQAVKGDTPATISIKVAPAPPPEEYPEIRAAVAEAQKEVKAGAKLKFTSLYTLGQVIGTGHYAR